MGQQKEFTLVIPTIGIPELFECLASIGPAPPYQTIVVIDDKGRSLSSLDGSLDELEQRIKVALPGVNIFHNTHWEDWQMNNQTFNIGISNTSTEFVYATHDDVIFPGGDYFEQVRSTISQLCGQGKRVVGAVFPGCHEEIAVTAPNWDRCGLTQYYSAVSSLLSVDFWNEVGRFDEKEGIWWDAQMQGELWSRDCWMYYEPLPAVLHRMNRALRANGHASGFTAAPLWANCSTAFERVYGYTSIDWCRWYQRQDQLITTS